MPFQVNLDGVAAVLDAFLTHPMARGVEAVLPGTVERVRIVRENLPEVASGVEARALEHVGRQLDRAFGDALDRYLRPPPKKRARKAPKKPKQLTRGRQR